MTTDKTAGWLPIDAAPRDGTLVLCGWPDGSWATLVWKENTRTGRTYFGDPLEMDDYELSDNPPTYYFPVPQVPNAI